MSDIEYGGGAQPKEYICMGIDSMWCYRYYMPHHNVDVVLAYLERRRGKSDRGAKNNV
jgi:hypothetical protein